MTTREEWLRERADKVGASKSATILGLNPCQSPYALWAEQSGLIEPADLSENEAVQWGIQLEPLVAERYTVVTGRELQDPGRYTVQYHATLPWMIATLDRIILPVNGTGPGALEIKTTGGHHAAEWEEDAPLPYQCQLQHQLAVTGFQWGSLAVLIGGQRFRYKDFPRNDNFIAYLIEREEEFLDLVRRQEPPPADGSESTAEAIRRLYPKDEGSTIAMPDEAITWKHLRESAKAALKAAEEELRELDNHIKAAIGPHSIGLLPDGSGFSYKTQHRAAYTVPEKSFRVLREIKP
jgi:putative phage-type endonuclease